MSGNGTHDAVAKLELSDSLVDPRDIPHPPTHFFIPEKYV